MKQILYKILFFSLVINSCFGQTLVNVTPCNINISQSLTGFEPDPLYGPWIWSYDTLTITNNSNCDIRVRPEFDVSHESSPIGATDFNLKWYNPFTGNWPIIPYYIDANGNAVGYWSIGGDSTGIILNQGTSQQIIIKVRFKPSANYGLYSASWSTQLLDSSGVFVQNLAMDSSFLSLIDCSIFEVDSFYSTNSNCYNSNTGSAAIVSIQNGSGQYIYNWSNGDTTNNVTNLGPGNYDCIITDQNWQQCTDTISISIDEPDSLNITENINPLLCFGDNNASVNLTISGGISPYNEIWANGITPNNLGPGIYSYTIIDSNGCTVNDSIIILEPIELTSTISSIDITNCIIDDGAIDLNVSGGTGQISYTWNNGSTNEDLVNLSAGTYIVVISDSNGCILTDTAVIDNYVSLLSISLSSPLYNGENLNCYADNSGSISSTTTGGVGQLVYTWSNGQTATSISNLSAGTYSLNIIDGLGCSATESIILSEPDELTSTYTKTDVSCFNANDGSAIVNFFGGTTGSVPGDTNYILGWQGLTNILFNPITQFETSVVAPNGIPAGIYPYSVTDLNGCTIYDTITIIEPDSLFITYATSNFSGFEIDCAGENSGEINIQINGGTAPFNHYLNGITQNSYNITNLVAGNYMDSIVDFNGCSASVSITLYEPDTLNGSLTSTQLDCYGDCDGEIYSSINGGVLPYNLQWNNGDTTDTITGICDGSYNLSITDQNGCNENVTISLIEPDELTSTYIKTDVSCFNANDGSAIVNFFGGTTGSVPGDTNYILGWQGLTNILFNPITQFETSVVAPNGIPAGIYPYSVTDLNGCTIYDTITIIEPDSLFITYATSNFSGFEIDCAGENSGEINIQINGGTAPFNHYLNGITQNSYNITNLVAGNYMDSIVDFNGCSASVSITLYEPDTLNGSLTSTQLDCYGDCDGEIYSSINGGVLPYNLQWNNGDTTDTITGICDGSYNLSITDQNGCNENVTISLIEPDEIDVVLDSLIDVNNYGGSDGAIYITFSGGTSPFNIVWTNNNTFLSFDEDLTNLSADIYFLEITDNNSCVYYDTLEIMQPPSLYITLDGSTNAICFDSCNGEINITANGGDSTYFYFWTGPNGFTSTSEDISNLCYGEYILTLDDGISSVTDTFNIFQPQPFVYNLIIDSINCYNDFTQAEINVWGGTQPYTYNWSSGGNNYFTSLNAGTYSISVLDINGCSMLESFTINNPDSIISIATTSNTSCFGGNDGSTNINIISGGIAPFTFSSNNGLTYQNSNIFSNLSAGNYSILISDSNNCLDSLNIQINSPTEIYSITSSDSLSCYNLCDGNVYVTAFGGTPPYNFSWDYGTSNLCAGLYNVIITDSNNCASVNNAIVNEPDPLLINIYISDSTLVATSGYNSYQWYSADGNIINGATNETFTPNTVGEYYVVVNNGECEEISYSIDYNISNILEIENNLQIYPNPTNGIITIIGEKIKNISIYNILGNQLSKVEKNNFNTNSRNIDLSNLARGIYTIQIEQNNKILNYQIILK